MKKIFTYFTLIFAAVAVLINLSMNDAHSYSAGAPAGRTGSPADGLTCATSTCHAGTATVSPNQIITSNIPATGYVPGQTYTITATVNQAGISEFGFQISPQSATGSLLGSLIVTNTAETKIVSSKYITHTSAGTAGASGTKTWSFNWLAPAAGTGSVTFYGSFNFSNNNGFASGDIIRTNTLTVTENQSTTGIEDFISNELSATIYPNPVQEGSGIRIFVPANENVSIQTFDLHGRLVLNQENFELNRGEHFITLKGLTDLQSGIYRILIKSGDKTLVESFAKQ